MDLVLVVADTLDRTVEGRGDESSRLGQLESRELELDTDATQPAVFSAFQRRQCIRISLWHVTCLQRSGAKTAHVLALALSMSAWTKEDDVASYTNIAACCWMGA